MKEEDPVAGGTRDLVRGARVVAGILIILRGFVFSVQWRRRRAASMDVHTKQLT